MQMGSKLSVSIDGPGLIHDAGGALKEDKWPMPPADGTLGATGTKEHGEAEVNAWTETYLLTEGILVNSAI
eukprot:evm.model.NODE_2309_length_17166_cov_20.591286.6